MGDSNSESDALNQGGGLMKNGKTKLGKMTKNQPKTKGMEIRENDRKEMLSGKKWKLCDAVEDDENEGPGSILLAWGRERAFHLLGLFSLLMCAILFTLQAYLAFRSYQIMHQLNTKPQIPELMYQIYFEGQDWAMNLDKVDLRANTTLYIH